MFGTTQRRKRCAKQFKVAAARVALGAETRVVDPAKGLGIEDPTLRRRAQEHGETGDAAFPGNGSPRVDRDCETVRLGKRVEEPGRENDLLKNFRALSSQGHA